MKYEQEDLLEKFIRNEKKSKFWALLFAVSFMLVAVTVVVVAKEVKGSSKNDDNATLRQQVDRLSVDYRECSNNYNSLIKEIEILKTELKECESRLQPGKNNQINILFKYDVNVSVNTVDKLQNLLNQLGMTINFSREMVQKKFEPEIKYFNSNDSKMAEYISSLINDPSIFASQIYCKTTFIPDGSKTTGNFEIWLIYIN